MRRTAVALALAVVLLGGCAEDSEAPEAAPASPSISTLSPLPMPDMGPPPGKVVADLRQASRDAALGRFQVWIGNGLQRDLDPRSIAYLDPRFPDPIPGERLRLNPSGSERGYPLALPLRPVCDAGRAAGRIELRYATGSGSRTVQVPVEDEADVVARYVASRCFEVAVAEVARLSFADDVPVEGEGEGSVGTLVLEVRPVRSGTGRLTVESVGGTPLLTSAGGEAWTPEVTVRAGGADRRIELPMMPARCDGHAFMEAGGATAFVVRLRLDGEPGDLVLRMSPEGASNAIAFARDSCGLG
jgi:hypothetical protein